MPPVERVALAAIVDDAPAQFRERLDARAVEEIAAALAADVRVEAEAVDLVREGARYVTADGHHRIEGYRRAGRTNVPARVHAGDRDDALLLGIRAGRANDRVRVTLADKRRAAEKLLASPRFAAWSDRAIADEVGLSHQTVGRIRAEVASTVRSGPWAIAVRTADPTDAREQALAALSPRAPSPIAVTGPLDQSPTPEPATQRVGRDGRTINTANIGARTALPPPRVSTPVVETHADEDLDDDVVDDGPRTPMPTVDEVRAREARMVKAVEEGVAPLREMVDAIAMVPALEREATALLAHIAAFGARFRGAPEPARSRFEDACVRIIAATAALCPELWPATAGAPLDPRAHLRVIRGGGER